MPWHNPFTAVMNSLLTSTQVNQMRDNFRYLKGLDGQVEIEDDLNVLGAISVNGTPLAGADPDFQRFTASGTWTKPTGVTLALVQIVGGGASGALDAPASGFAWQGGGPGDVVWHLFLASELSATETVTVAAAQTTAKTNGNNSSFGGLTAKGGDAPSTSSNIWNILWQLLPPGHGGPQVGSSNINSNGKAGLGLGAHTAGATDGADSPNGAGTGSGGGGGQATTPFGAGGDGGAPGGGGGSGRGAGNFGNGARGEVRVWSW